VIGGLESSCGGGGRAVVLFGLHLEIKQDAQIKVMKGGVSAKKAHDYAAVDISMIRSK
jgi:hypothetical protein